MADQYLEEHSGDKVLARILALVDELGLEGELQGTHDDIGHNLTVVDELGLEGELQGTHDDVGHNLTVVDELGLKGRTARHP